MSFPVLITDLSEWAGVPFSNATDVRVAPATSSNINQIEVDYLRYVEARKSAPVDMTPVLETESLEEGTTPSSPIELTGTSTTTSTSTVPPPSSKSRTPLTQAMVYRMGKLSHLADGSASRFEAAVLSMIAAAIEGFLSPRREEMTGYFSLLAEYGLCLDTLIARVEEWELVEGSSTDLTALWVDIVVLRRDVD